MDKFNTILDSLAEVIEEKNKQILLLRWELEKAEAKLAEAENVAVHAKAEADGVLCKKRVEYKEENE